MFTRANELCYCCFSVEVVDREAIGVSNIFYKLLIYNEQIIINDLGESEQRDLVPNFFRQMARLTCHFAEKASLQEDSVRESTNSWSK